MTELVTLTVTICTACLSGAEGECHSPGCLFWMCPAPTAEQAARIGGWGQGEPAVQLQDVLGPALRDLDGGQFDV